MLYQLPEERQSIFHTSQPPGPTSSFRGIAPFFLHLSSATKQRAQTNPVASTQLPSLLQPTFRLFFSFCPGLFIFCSLLLRERIHQKTRAELVRTNHPTLLLSPGSSSGPQSCPQRGDLLRVVDQDPGFWLGERGQGTRGVVWCGDECPVSGWKEGIVVCN